MVSICPVCRKRTTWEENTWRPFCSERCKLVDFDKWVDEEYKIAGTIKDGEQEKQKEIT